MKNARAAWLQGGFTLASAVTLTSSLLCASGCSGSEDTATESKGATEEHAEAWQATLGETHASSGVPASSLGVWSSKLNMDRPWIGVAGVADIASQRPVEPSDTFRIGSVTKTFVATVTLALVEEGKLDLEDPLSRWGGFGVPDAEEITVFQLLTHRSGLGDFTQTPEAQMQAGEAQTDPQLIELALKKGQLFEPGTSWAYSNTNYVLLGMIIEQVTGESWAEQIHQRIIEPLGMSHTFVSGYDPDPSNLVSGYMALDGEYADTTRMLHPSWTGAAGGIVSNAEDVVLFGKALFHGELIGKPLLDQMIARTSEVGARDGSTGYYGMGVIIMDSDDWTMVGHGGTIPGYEAWLGYVPDADLVIASMHNSAFGPDGMTPQNLVEPTAFLTAHLSELQQ